MHEVDSETKRDKFVILVNSRKKVPNYKGNLQTESDRHYMDKSGHGEQLRGEKSIKITTMVHLIRP